MKKKKVSALFCGVMAAAIGLAGCGAGGNMQLIDGNNYKKASVRNASTYYSETFDITGGSDVMPLGVWWGPYSSSSGDTVNGNTQPDYITDEMFELLVDSGVNFIAVTADQYPNNQNGIMEVLDFCEKYDVGYFVQDKRIGTAKNAAEVNNLVSDYIDHPACLGVHFKDEPFRADFEDVYAAFNVFHDYVDEYKKDKMAYVNMLPSYAGTDRLGGSYYDYMSDYAKNTDVKFLSYDNYPLRSKDQGTTTSIALNYFSDLSTTRKVANENEIPFWVFVQAGGQWEEKRGLPSDPLFPNEGETLWNVNTCLAYGAKSIQYFTFLQPTYFAEAGGNNRDYQRNGMIGAMGNKTQYYYYIQKANQQIKAIDHILMNSAHMGIFATGFWSDRLETADKPAGAKERSWRELTNITSSNEEMGVIVGCFDYNFEGGKSRSAYYVVNTDSTEKQEVTLSFDKKYGYDIIQRGESIGVTGKTITLTLERGEGVMVALR